MQLQIPEHLKFAELFLRQLDCRIIAPPGVVMMKYTQGMVLRQDMSIIHLPYNGATGPHVSTDQPCFSRVIRTHQSHMHIENWHVSVCKAGIMTAIPRVQIINSREAPIDTRHLQMRLCLCQGMCSDAL